jgi:hypothetical protein
LEGNATEAQADFDAAVPRVLAQGTPRRGQHLEVVVAHDQVVGDTGLLSGLKRLTADSAIRV